MSSIFINNGVVMLTPDDNNLYTYEIIQQVNQAMILGFWVYEFPESFELQEVGTYINYEFVNGPNYSDNTNINYTPPTKTGGYTYPNKKPEYSEEKSSNYNDIFIGLIGALFAYSFYVVQKNK